MKIGETSEFVNIFDVFDDNFVLLLNENLIGGFSFTLDPSFFDERDYTQFGNSMLPLFKENLRAYLVYRRRRIQNVRILQSLSQQNERTEFMKKSIEDFFNSVPTYKEDFYLFVEGGIGEMLKEKTRGGKIFLKTSAWIERRFIEEKDKFEKKFRGIQEVLRGISPTVKLLSSEEVASILFSLFSFQKVPHRISGINLYQLFSSQDIGIENGFLRVADVYATVISLANIPPFEFQDFFESLRGLPIDYFFTQIVSSVNKSKALALMGPVTNMASKLARYSFLGPFAERMKSIAYMNSSVMEAIENGETPMEFSLYIVLYSNNVDMLRNLREFIVSKNLERKTHFVVENFNLLTSFFAAIPGHNTYNLRKKIILSGSLVDLLSIYSETTGHESPIMIFHTERDSLFKIDPFSGKQNAWNFFVTGSTGSGKSFFMNYYLVNTLSYDPHVFIFDYGGSYKAIAELLEAGILKVDLSSTKVRLNPFRVPKLDKKHLQYLVLFVEALVSEGEEIDLNRKVDVTTAIKRAFSKAGISEGDEIKNDVVPTLSDIREELKEINSDLYKKLSLWSKGNDGELYGNFFDNDQDNFFFRKIHYIEMTGFDNDPKLASVMVFVLFNKIFDTISNSPGKKLIILDEVWRFLLNPIMAKKIEELFRTSRKYGGSIGIITQHPDDVINSPYAEGILANTQVKYFLHQKEIREEERWKNIFKFNDRALRILTNLKTIPGEYSEILVWSDLMRKKIRLRVPPLLYWLFTTREEEKRLREKYIKDYGLKQGIGKLVNRFPGGFDAKKEVNF